MFSKDTEEKVSRSGRAACYKVCSLPAQGAWLARGVLAAVVAYANSCLLLVQARDNFYQCLKESGVLHTSSGPVPTKCAKLRAAFEGACLPSWVSRMEPLPSYVAARTMLFPSSCHASYFVPCLLAPEVARRWLLGCTGCLHLVSSSSYTLESEVSP
jgi:hypothetical protein